jgi:cell division transport system permease protein
MFLSFFRVIKFSFQDILRNIWLSLVTILILFLALFSVNLLLTVKVISSTAVDSVKEKIDMSFYLNENAKEEQIAILKSKISAIEGIKEVKYVSKEEALKSFTSKHKEDSSILEALKELNNNPLSASLVVRPENVDDYKGLINNLEKIEDGIIESRNFNDHKVMIEKIDGITKKISDAGVAVSSIFIFITLLVIYNTVKIAIYTHKEEISIMRLVGASNFFIKSPFLLSSIIYTLIGALFSIFCFYLFLTLLQPYLETFFTGYSFDILLYFESNFIKIFGLEILISAIINVFASLFAVDKYSDV